MSAAKTILSAFVVPRHDGFSFNLIPYSRQPSDEATVEDRHRWQAHKLPGDITEKDRRGWAILQEVGRETLLDCHKALTADNLKDFTNSLKERFTAGGYDDRYILGSIQFLPTRGFRNSRPGLWCGHSSFCEVGYEIKMSSDDTEDKVNIEYLVSEESNASIRYLGKMLGKQVRDLVVGHLSSAPVTQDSEIKSALTKTWEEVYGAHLNGGGTNEFMLGTMRFVTGQDCRE